MGARVPAVETVASCTDTPEGARELVGGHCRRGHMRGTPTAGGSSGEGYAGVEVSQAEARQVALPGCA